MLDHCARHPPSLTLFKRATYHESVARMIGRWTFAGRSSLPERGGGDSAQWTG